MRLSRIKKTSIFAVLFLLAALLLPLSGATAQDKQAEEVGRGEAREIESGNMYIDKDMMLRNPAAKKIKEECLESLPEGMQPDSLKDKPEDKTKKASGGEDITGAGTGGWYPIRRAFAPGADPNYHEVDTSRWSNAVDQNGVMHSCFTATTQVNIRQAPDPGPSAMNMNLADVYYAKYLNGSWSTPVSLASPGGLEDCDIVMWEFDENNYLHFIYTKWTWGRDSTYPAAEPPNANAYIHTNENLFYRYMAPDGTWSTPKQITNLPNGAWDIQSGFLNVVNNRVYGTVGAALNKMTAPISETNRYLYIEGYLNDWEGVHVLKDWDGTYAPGGEIGLLTPIYDVSRVNGEVTVLFSNILIGADAFSTKSKVYGAVKSGAGTWSSTSKLFTGVSGESWTFMIGYYGDSSLACRFLGYKSVFGADATHKPAGNFMLLEHDTSGWQTAVNLTKLPTEQIVGTADFLIDPMGFMHIVFSAEHRSWDGASWNNNGESFHYAHETADGAAAVENVAPYAANREGDWLIAFMDVNGKIHNAMTTLDITSGADYKLYYGDNVSGSWSTPTQLSVDNGQEIGPIQLSVSPEIRTMVTWQESRLSGAGVPEVGRLCSMTCQNGSWSSRKNISAIPGSSVIIHTVAGWPWFADVAVGNQGDQICIFETAKYNSGTATYYDFNKYYCESMNGTWSSPELISNLNMSGYGDTWLDRNNITRAMWDVIDTATNDDVLYGTMQKQPTPSASTYYFAEGTTRDGFQEWLSLQNAGEAEADVTITYMLGTGENKDQEVKVPAHSRVTVDVNGFVGPGQDVSASVVSNRLIVAERPMYFNYQGGIPGGHVGVGSTTTSRVLFFAEGTTRSGFNEYLTLQNPSKTDTEVTITYMFGDGTTMEQKVTVNKKTRQTVDVNAFVGADKDFSIKIVSPEIAIAAERPMYFNYHAILQGGHNAVASNSLDSRWYFAEGTTRPGFDTYLCLQNPGPVDATANITYIMGDGSTTEQPVDLPSTSRQTVNVRDTIGSDKDVSMVVDADTLILAERPMYFDYHGIAGGGHNVMGGHELKNAWYLAEGTTRTGFDEWVCLENPSGQDGAAVLSYMLGDGSVVNQDVAVPAHTRVTVDVRLAVGNDKDVSTYIWCDKGIIAERPMYFTNGDRRWNGGSCVMGF